MNSSTAPSLRSAYLVVAFGFFAVLFEGYDLIVFGAAVPALLAYPDWSLTAAQVGAIGAAALFGMVFGAPISGWLADRFGRRKLFIGLLIFFSFMMVLVSLAQTPAQLGLFRFLAGLGFGGIPPTAIALVIEFAPARRKALFNSIMLTGFAVGAILAGGLSILLLPHAGFRGMFAMGALPLVTLVPLAVWLLPESPEYLRKSAVQALGRVNASPLRHIFRGQFGVATVLFAAANFCAFMMVFGLNTWLPLLMRSAGYVLGDALKFLVLFNVGALVGGILGAWLADRFGMRLVGSGLYLIAAACLGLLAIPAPTIFKVLLVFAIGTTLGGGQLVLWSYVATFYTPESRATAVGVSSGIGRLGAAVGPVVGGLLISTGVGLGGNVVVLSVAAVLAAIMIFLVPRMLAASATISIPRTASLPVQAQT